MLDAFIGRTLKPFLIVFGLLTGVTVLFALDFNLFGVMFRDLVDTTPASVPAIRHWGIMVFGIGMLMIAAAFRPWLRFETMVFAALEKAFLLYLFASDLGEPWIMGYAGPVIVDSIVVAYSLLYFISRHGRPQRWIPAPG
jgi:glucan phosphoethanolaminetransferase (alkaline phosphatase superfamily)